MSPIWEPAPGATAGRPVPSNALISGRRSFLFSSLGGIFAARQNCNGFPNHEISCSGIFKRRTDVSRQCRDKPEPTDLFL